ncbi:tRNA (adenosine(37)-N6)-threonylcarbamoyltransferase complex ATPase subunit type 1 TsaE [Pseudaestuariivita rosea]|uniref:tRNA (adenosine(37)-N6)-threonylcarbamoyltransferase complex ATPase subunit type 1 TsaE n=1 Tax=Pseudaestuariivita rosea TaxID=2763263 RepID=UPI001ABA36E1|nr:tRNA (adenosine(37)-N6)-threonylcarbamoyltransferase complex ATPase subunit type 1 TsaE [Pseudaestuariivita rosea]
MAEQLLYIPLPNEDATRKLAHIISSSIAVGDTILLQGDIGAGKTFFARALIKALIGPDEDVPSPTFTLVQIYQTETFEIWHCDLYRLTSPDEALELGLEEVFAEAVCLIEWPDRLGDAVPKECLTLRFQALDNGQHEVNVTASTPRWQRLLEQLSESQTTTNS